MRKLSRIVSRIAFLSALREVPKKPVFSPAEFDNGGKLFPLETSPQMSFMAEKIVFYVL